MNQYFWIAVLALFTLPVVVVAAFKYVEYLDRKADERFMREHDK